MAKKPTSYTRVICGACGNEHNHSDAHETEDRSLEEGLRDAACHKCGAKKLSLAGALAERGFEE